MFVCKIDVFPTLTYSIFSFRDTYTIVYIVISWVNISNFHFSKVPTTIPPSSFSTWSLLPPSPRNVVCGVCSAGYGRGAAHTCHECTQEFKGAMYFILAVASVLIVIAIVLLGIYLVIFLIGPELNPPENLFKLTNCSNAVKSISIRFRV